MSPPAETPHRRKQVQEFSWANIAPPYDDHPYFEGHEHHPFHARASDFQLVNAWWLAEASTLVYSDPVFVQEQFRSAGFTDIRFITAGKSTQCFVASRDTHAFVVFRGTEVRQRDASFRGAFRDWLTILDVKPDVWQGPGKVHSGFRDAFEEIRADLERHLLSLGDRALWFSGHSLGSAVATLAAARLGRAQGLYTFGSPRVGDQDFAGAFAPMTFRFVHNEDLVTHVPPAPYRHVGVLRYIDDVGVVRTEAPTSMLADAQRAARRSARFLRRLANGLDHLIPLGIEDHVPVLYATHIWNQLAATA